MFKTHRPFVTVLALAAATLSLASQAATIGRNSGSTSPNASDFSAAFNNHAQQVGYGNTATDRMFRETFRVECPRGQYVAKARFSIELTKLTQGANRGDNDALAFWEGGTPVFNTYLWTPGQGPGTTRSLVLDFGALPAAGSALPGGGSVITSPAGGNGMGLFTDQDFSFSVQDDTSVRAARLDYSCAMRQGDATSGTGTGVSTVGVPIGAGNSAAVDPRKTGMTWGVYPAEAVSGTITVSCQGQPGTACNAYNGDTPAATALPVLCMKPSSLPNPQPNTADAAHWSGNVIATTPAVSPAAQAWAHKSQVNAYCA